MPRRSYTKADSCIYCNLSTFFILYKSKSQDDDPTWLGLLSWLHLFRHPFPLLQVWISTHFTKLREPPQSINQWKMVSVCWQIQFIYRKKSTLDLSYRPWRNLGVFRPSFLGFLNKRKAFKGLVFLCSVYCLF